MNIFIREIIGFCNNSIYYGDTDSLYIEKKHWDVFDKENLVGKNLCIDNFFKYFCQNPECEKTHCNRSINPFHFAHRKWYLYINPQC